MHDLSKRTTQTLPLQRLKVSEAAVVWLADCILQETRERTVPLLRPEALPDELLELHRNAICVGEGAILLLSFDDSLPPEQMKRAALALTALIGKVVQVEDDVYDYWYSLGVDPAASPVAANGLGPNVPHIDMLTYSDFPNAMAILCERSDPSGGGATVLSDIRGAISELSRDHQQALREAVFSYWEDHGLINVGGYLPTWSILPTPLDPRFRFTSKLLNRMAKEPLPVENSVPYLAAVSELIKSLEAHSTSIQLKAGDLVLFSQNEYCHGRTGLGTGALDVPSDARRQLWRLYFNHQ
jgi:hypothetical protein